LAEGELAARRGLMKTEQEAQAAIAGVNGQQSGGRSLTVNEAKPRENRGGRRY
jgi:hypothetical protein